MSAVGMILAVMMAAAGNAMDEPHVGWASQYDQGVMERVLAYQQRRGRAPQDVSNYDGFIAVRHCADVGRTMYLRPVGARRWERFLAVDCAGPDGTLNWMRRNNIFVEVDYHTAQRWHTVGHGIQIEMLTMW